MDKYLNKLLYGKRENRVVIHQALGIPDDTIDLDDLVKDRPHIAYKDSVINIWDVDLQEWIQIIPASLNDKVTINTDDTYVLQDTFMIWKIAIKPDVDSTIRIGLTPGGDEVLNDIDIPGGTWYSITFDVFTNGADRNVYLQGVTDVTIFNIYKLPL